MIEKQFKFWVTLNWQKGTVKSNKKCPTKLSVYEIPVEMNLKVQIPDKPNPKATGTITLSDTKVEELILENI